MEANKDQGPTVSREAYIHLLEDEIARLRRWIDELVRMHYRLDEPPQQ